MVNSLILARQRPFAAGAAALRCVGVYVVALLLCPQVLAETSAPLPSTERQKLQRPKSEAEHVAKINAALAPLMDVSLSASDGDAIRNAIAAVKANNLSRANQLTAEIGDPVGRKLVTWVKLRAGYGTAVEYQKFLSENPLWPDRTMMIQRMEEALFIQGGSASSIKAFFKSSQPVTGIGYAALASANLAEGNKDGAKKLAAKAWREMTIPATLETGFLRRFSELLTEADHKWRFDRMVTDDVRWAENRAERAAYARRVIPLLSAQEQKKATARLAVFSKSSNARGLIEAVPGGHEADTGLAFHRAQVLRKAGKVEDAAKIILSVPPDPEKIAVLDEWWAERRQLAYGALKAGKHKLAYELTKDAGPLTVNPRKEQTFMAGWIAWRYLKDANRAEKHFKDFAEAADGPLSRAKAAFWLGNLAESRGDKAGAESYYQSAAKNPDTFHGLMAMRKLQPDRTSIDISPPQFPTSDQIKNFVSQDAAKAIVIAKKANLSREYTRPFLTSLRIGLPSEAEAGLIAHMADALGDTQMSVRIAKSAIARGQNLLTYGYPVHTFPDYKPLVTPPETAFLLGITRQETEFEPSTVSGAGAKGLMQVMTVTAKHVCKDYKIKCDIPRLLTDTSYNATIASAYIGDRMREFSGSYVLGLAGYNAGPGRARQWIRENGDPRDPNVDPIDWIERIPITETREYVTKVLSNIQIYRARIGNEANALKIVEDLERARGDSKKSPAGKDDAAPIGSAENTEG